MADNPRIAITRRALVRAVTDMVRAGERVSRLRARLARLEAAERIPEAERKARARRAWETRKTQGKTRKIALD